ncbi:MAG: lipid A biosynthesis acyltransferase, partial [Azonexus sp.]
MTNALSYLAIAFLWLLHWLPLPALRALGWGLGRLLFVLARARREIALINLRLCFPEMSEVERANLARAHFVAFSRAVLDRTLGWWASRERLERIIRIAGAEHLSDPGGRPTIV